MKDKQNVVFIGLVVLVIGVVLLLLGYLFCFKTIGQGEVGVISWFGKLEDQTLESGPHIVNPFKSVARVSIQKQRNEEQATVPTKSGLSVGVKAIMIYRLEPTKVPQLMREVGPTYEEKLLDPVFRNSVRDATAEFEAESLYTDARSKVESMIFDKVTKELSSNGYFVVEQVMLQDPVLPTSVQDRINAKVSAEQDAIRTQYIFKQQELQAKANARQAEPEAEGQLKRKELEAQAKAVEAKGIAEAQLIIKKDLDDNYLRYLWIEALKESAKHNNATIYIPTGNDGMPLFKSVDVKGGK